jgi:hypothetical protein
LTSAKSLFEDDELELLRKVAKKDNTDLENSSDLLDAAPSLEDIPHKTDEEIARLPQDKVFTKKEDFSFADFLPEKESFQPISEERKKELEKENTEIYNGYLLWQSMQPDFKLHVLLGRNEETGESKWLEKSFKYHPVTKGQKLRLELKRARIADLTRRKNELLQKPYSQLSSEEQYELTYFNTLVNIAQYKFEALQAKLYFNMSEEDFNAINTAEYTWALSAAQYKENFTPFSSTQRQDKNSSAGVT